MDLQALHFTRSPLLLQGTPGQRVVDGGRLCALRLSFPVLTYCLQNKAVLVVHRATMSDAQCLL